MTAEPVGARPHGRAGRDGGRGRRPGGRRRLPICTRGSTSTAPSGWRAIWSTFNLMWLEEPVPPENIDAMREVTRGHLDADLRRREPLPAPRLPRPDRAAGGRHHHARHPQVRRALGMPQDRRTWPSSTRCPFAPHNVSSPIGTMASAHVCATIPNFLVLEFHWPHRDYWSTIITEKRRHHQGRLHRDRATGPASGSSSTRRWRRRTSIPARPGLNEAGSARIDRKDAGCFSALRSPRGTTTTTG